MHDIVHFARQLSNREVNKMTCIMHNRADSLRIILHDMAEQPGAAAFLGTNVRRLRDEIGLSQQKLADAAGLSRSTIAAIEAGRYSSADTGTVAALARVLGVAPGSLLIPHPSSAPSAQLVDEFLASPWAGPIQATEPELDWLRSLPDIVFFGARPDPEAIAKIIQWRRENQKRG